MEDVLSVYARPYDDNFPVVCMDEKPVQLFANARKSFRSTDRRIEYEDHEYIRSGTACIFKLNRSMAGASLMHRNTGHVRIGPKNQVASG